MSENNSISGNNGYPNPNRSPARRPKSVTFDKEVEQVLEYEMVTPEPSIEGSPGDRYDSEETDDEDYDLENTPVIEPDAWGRLMPDGPHNELSDPFRQTPSPSSRPLPPLPGMPRAESDSPNGGRPLPTLPLSNSHPRMSLHLVFVVFLVVRRHVVGHVRFWGGVSPRVFPDLPPRDSLWALLNHH